VVQRMESCRYGLSRPVPETSFGGRGGCRGFGGKRLEALIQRIREGNLRGASLKWDGGSGIKKGSGISRNLSTFLRFGQSSMGERSFAVEST